MSIRKHIAQAVRLYESFRERKPRRIADVKVRVPKAVACIGYVEGIDYRTTHGKKVTLYHHDFVPGSRPLLAVSGDGSQLLLLGGRYEFTERGIVDKDADGREIENAGHDKTINPRRVYLSGRMLDVFNRSLKREEVIAVEKVARKRKPWIVTRATAEGEKIGSESFDTEAQALQIAGEIKSGLEGSGKRRKRNPVATLEEDGATVRAVLARESAFFEQLRNGTSNGRNVPARTTSEVEAFRRYQKGMARLAKEAFT